MNIVVNAEHLRREAIFGWPTSNSDDSVLVSSIFDLLAKAGSGAQLHISMLRITERWFIAPLLAAINRGAAVNIIVDAGSEKSPAVQREIIAKLRNAGTQVTECFRGCGGRQLYRDRAPLNHNKFILLSDPELGAFTLQTTSNITSSIYNKHQSAVLFCQDEALYETYLNYWLDLKYLSDTDYRIGTYFKSRVIDNDLKVVFLPSMHTDPLLDSIKEAVERCGDEKAEICIAMAYWTAGRSDLYRYLAGLFNAGHHVRLVTSRTYISREIVHEIRQGNIPAVDVPEMHSKYILISSTSTHTTITGSLNFTEYAIRQNDEAMIVIDDERLHANFTENWEALWSTGDVLVA